ncbi:MAG: HEPN domain-containing protein [Chloroflexi bacterium]|nr:HEPN domain-containing protein [Chloroflexota bacterium]
MSAKANEWLTRAKADLTAAEMLQTFEEYPIAILAFHCQQAVEKSLKAFLTAQDVPFLFRHDLGYLLDLCINADPDLAELESEIADLTPFAVEGRYPTDIPLEPTKEEGRAFYQQAKNAFAFVSKKIESGESA